jgi:hypothetical protein
VKYADLPKEETVQKLVATSFESPSLNWAVYDWSEKILKHIQFLENERVKLVKRYGEADAQGNCKVPNEKLPEFRKVFAELLNTEIPETIEKCPITKESFSDGKCCYPKEKELWISPIEIYTLLK